MSRTRYVWSKTKREWVTPAERAASDAPMVVKDFQGAFLSMADGKTVITNRSQYRTHLKDHGCVEVGNTPIAPRQEGRHDPVAPVLKDVWNNRHSPDALYNIRESGKLRD